MRVAALILALTLTGCGTMETNQSAQLCLGLCLELKNKITKGKPYAPQKSTSSSHDGCDDS